MKFFLAFCIISICFSLLEVEKNKFTIISLQRSIKPCNMDKDDEAYYYYFQILGNFTEIPLKNNAIEISLNSPKGAKAICLPEESLNFGFKCKVLLDKYNLNEKLVIDPQPPISKNIYFYKLE